MSNHATGATILVIDNDPGLRASLAEDVLKPEGYRVFQASSAEEAKKLLDENLIHLAVVDVRLREDKNPNDQSGLDFCKELDALVARVIVTGFPDDWRLVRTALLPSSKRHHLVDYFISKGDDGMQGDLLAVIQKCLNEEFEIIPRKRIGVLTSGGDAPGMNAAIWAIVRTAMSNGIEVIGVEDGYEGLTNNQMYKLRWNHVSDILLQGGTILGTSRFEDFKNPVIRAKAVENIYRKHISGLIVIGGDGSMQGATALANDLKERNISLQTIAIPGTIDNDLHGTDMSLGAASAANAMIEVLRDMIRPAQALRRIFVCEVMGRYSGFLALEAAMGIGADVVLIPECIVEVRSPRKSTAAGPFKGRIDRRKTTKNLHSELDEAAKTLEAAFALGKRYAFVILAEGIGQLTNGELNAKYVRGYLEDCIQDWTIDSLPDVREHVLGYPVRGVPPSRFDIWLGAELGAEAVRCLIEEKSGLMVGWTEEAGVIETPFAEVVAKSNRPPKEKWPDRPKWQRLLELQRVIACPPSLRETLLANGNRFVV